MNDPPPLTPAHLVDLLAALGSFDDVERAYADHELSLASLDAGSADARPDEVWTDEYLAHLELTA